MIVFPNAKVNLGLNILGKRPDGYHDLQSIFLPVPWRDVLEVVEAPELASGEIQLSMSGLSIEGEATNNLVTKAYQILAAEHKLPGIKAHLHKVIPMGAGLGGGSADGAFMLVLLNDLFHLQLSNQDLEKLAAELGSDCPFFIQNKPMLVKGRGEILEETTFQPNAWWIYLVWPKIHIGTAEAFAGITPRTANIPSLDYSAKDLENGTFQPINDFEPGVASNHTSINAIRQQLLNAGAFYVAMTGTGSTVYGLFKDKPQPIPTVSNAISWIAPL